MCHRFECEKCCLCFRNSCNLFWCVFSLYQQKRLWFFSQDGKHQKKVNGILFKAFSVCRLLVGPLLHWFSFSLFRVIREEILSRFTVEWGVLTHRRMVRVRRVWAWCHCSGIHRHLLRCRRRFSSLVQRVALTTSQMIEHPAVKPPDDQLLI